MKTIKIYIRDIIMPFGILNSGYLAGGQKYLTYFMYLFLETRHYIFLHILHVLINIVHSYI